MKENNAAVKPGSNKRPAAAATAVQPQVEHSTLQLLSTIANDVFAGWQKRVVCNCSLLIKACPTGIGWCAGGHKVCRGIALAENDPHDITRSARSTHQLY